MALAAIGRPERAIEELLRVVEVADDQEIPRQNLDRRLLALGWAHLVRGDLHEATRFADAASESARRHGDDGTRGWALLLGGVARSRGEPDDGASPAPFFEAALDVARERFLLPLAAHTYLEKARWISAAGEWTELYAPARAAADLFRRLGLDGPARAAEQLTSQPHLP